MATNVTVQGAHGLTLPLAFDSNANALLAQQVANAILNGINASSITPADSQFNGITPPALHGKIGEWVQDVSGSTNIPTGYDYIVDAAAVANLTDKNTDSGQSVLVGGGNLVFIASGSGTLIGGGGNESIGIPAGDSGAWYITAGGGNDTVVALGSGNDTINLGNGSDSVYLGGGSSSVTTGLSSVGGAATPSGSATITATTGSETVTGFGTTVVFGGSSNLTFLAGGAATVFGGTGSATVTGGGGPDYFQGGTGGSNVLTAGIGAATLFGGGSGDTLFAHGENNHQILFAGIGNETLTGSSGGGASDTFVGSAGSSTVVATTNASNVFEFIHGSAGGKMFVTGLTSIGQVDLHLDSYASNSLASVAAQDNNAGNLNITLSDGTQITFQNITSPLTNSNFS